MSKKKKKKSSKQGKGGVERIRTRGINVPTAKFLSGKTREGPK